MRGRLSKQEEVEVRRTYANMFNWLKPPTKIPVVGKEIPTMIEEPEEMEVDEREQEERLERVKRKQREYQTTSLCRGLMDEIILDTIQWSGRQVCMELMEEVVVDGSWEILPLMEERTERRQWKTT